MKLNNFLPILLAGLVAAVISSCAFSGPPKTGGFPAGIDHGPWSELLGKYVNDKGLVNYAGLKANKTDLQKLDSYLAEFGETGGRKAKGDELVATATNAYNAFAIRTIVSNYPTKSIRDIDGAFTKKTHNISGEMLSLDDIEKGNIVPVYGEDTHAIVVCCAKSCPPLQNEAYTKKNLRSLTATASSEWLGRSDLNDFSSDPKKIKISKIFDWYKSDFEKGIGLRPWLKKHAPEQYGSKIDTADIGHLKYNWDLNSQ